MSMFELASGPVNVPELELSELHWSVAAERFRNGCGIGTTAVQGSAPPGLLADLRASCVRIVSPSGDSSYPNILLTMAAAEPDEGWLDAHWTDIAAATDSVALLLYGRAIDPALRVAWESALIQRGLRKHPRTEFVAPYNELDLRSDFMMLLFEPVPANALSEYPLQALREERDLHMDMMREAGRRSDAHLTRYVQAARFVRPGDRVVDVACGLGYGGHVLMSQTHACSLLGIDASEYAVRYANLNFSRGENWIRYQTGDAEDLSSIGDASVDFAMSVETLEHLHHPEKLLAELMRVLTPGGRAYLSVPYDWADETGHDPNPFHHHVYDWPILASQATGQGFIIERAWTQDAGGGQRLPDAARALHEFDPEQGPQRDGEWLLALVFKPLQPEPVGQSDMGKETPNILAFARDYSNPWLVRGLVSIGLRVTSPAARLRVAQTTLAHATAGSADHGAALCVLCYQALEAGCPIEMARAAREAAAWRPADPANPTQLRWQVSLGYVGALLQLALGEPDTAAGLFERTSAFDALKYSPLLGTKTVGANVRLGLLSLSSGDEQAARGSFVHAIKEALRLAGSGHWTEVIGPDVSRPTTFGLPELALVLAEAAKAAYALHGLSARRGRPGQVWQLLRQAGNAEGGALRLENQALRKWISDLDAGKQWLETRIAHEEQARHAEREGKVWLEEQYQLLSSEIQRLDAVLSASKEESATLEEGRRWLESQYRAYANELDAARAREAELRETLDSLSEAKAWLEEQYHSLTDALATSQIQNQQLTEQMEELARLHRQEREQALARIAQLEASLPQRLASALYRLIRRILK